LSGFVIAYAYGQRLDNGLAWSGFMRLRVIRLYPMLIAGVLVGGMVFLGRQIVLHSGLYGEAAALTVLALSLLPGGLLFGLDSYPIDSPVWSLFFEFVANAVYASPVRRLGRPWALALLGVAVAALIVLVGSFKSVGFLGGMGAGSFFGGFARVAAPFGLGVAIWQMNLFTKLPSIPFAIVAVALGVVLCAHTSPAMIWDLAAVLVMLPVLVCLGARARVGGRAKRFCNLAGRLSYPLYIIHESVLRTVDMGYKLSHIRIGPFLPMCLGIVLSLVVSWAFLRLYDEPVRQWLRARFSGNRSLATRVTAV
jgi:peptidoglycan/LPS O-acetylase OafA/YrhL